MGDKIRSPKFAFAYYDTREPEVTLIGGGKDQVENVTIGVDERVAIAAQTGVDPGDRRTTNVSRYDESRGEAVFVVESAYSDSAGSYDGTPFPTNWLVTARRLFPGDAYDPFGEVIRFYMTGHFMEMVSMKDLEITGTMQLFFI